MAHSGQGLREAFLWHPASLRTIVVAVDHGLFMGPIPGCRDLGALLPQLVGGGADAIQLTPGQAAQHAATFHGRGAPALVVRLDACNIWRKGKVKSQPGYWTAVGSPRRALQLGAHIAVCFLLYGWEDDGAEASNLAQVGRWAEECGDLGLPLMVEPLPIGPQVSDENDADCVALGVRMAVEVGASLIKCNYTGQVESFRDIVASCPVPILARGGPKAPTEMQYLAQVRDIVVAGGRGLVVGRNVFQAEHPAETLRKLVSLVHDQSLRAS
jgi:fructose-bisphosphate aldolase/2-amino-3,7-dideoxy-D-threo-hept-6-ulosonate synthase